MAGSREALAGIKPLDGAFAHLTKVGGTANAVMEKASRTEDKLCRSMLLTEVQLARLCGALGGYERDLYRVAQVAESGHGGSAGDTPVQAAGIAGAAGRGAQVAEESERVWAAPARTALHAGAETAGWAKDMTRTGQPIAPVTRAETAGWAKDMIRTGQPIAPVTRAETAGWAKDMIRTGQPIAPVTRAETAGWAKDMNRTSQPIDPVTRAAMQAVVTMARLQAVQYGGGERGAALARGGYGDAKLDMYGEAARRTIERAAGVGTSGTGSAPGAVGMQSELRVLREMMVDVTEARAAGRERMAANASGGIFPGGALRDIIMDGAAAQAFGRERIAANANGGIYPGRPFLSLIAEDGPEAVIPLGAKRRTRALELWQQAGAQLGVARMADGGVFSAAEGSSLNVVAVAARERAAAVPGGRGAGAARVALGGMHNEFKFDIHALGGGIDADELRGKLSEITDEISFELSKKLETAFSNTPVI